MKLHHLNYDYNEMRNFCQAADETDADEVIRSKLEMMGEDVNPRNFKIAKAQMSWHLQVHGFCAEW